MQKVSTSSFVVSSSMTICPGIHSALSNGSVAAIAMGKNTMWLPGFEQDVHINVFNISRSSIPTPSDVLRSFLSHGEAAGAAAGYRTRELPPAAEAQVLPY